ncbi:TIGR02679 domain-containing protein [Streptomyces viridiviolaceus]
MPSDLNDPDVRPLWQALADRLARGEAPATIKTVTAVLNPTGHAMITGWLAHGPSPSRRPLKTGPNGTTVPVSRLLTALGHTYQDLPDLVESTGLAIPPTGQDRRTAHHLRTTIDTYAEQALPDTPLLTTRLRSYGISAATLTERRHLIDALARARSLLPLPRPVHLARLAHHCTGDPHYFDLTGGPGALLVLLTRDLLHAAPPDTPAAERALLAQVGITAERLSQTVLVLNLRAAGSGPTDRALNLAHDDRRPHHLTLYDLTSHPPRLATDQVLLAVENPSLIDEALERHVKKPIACTSGSLTAVDHVLLNLARDSGVPITYAGDLDTWGHDVARIVSSRYTATITGMDHVIHRTALDAEPPWAFATPPSTDTSAGRRQAHANAPAENRALARIYQENPAILDLLLGQSADDPLPRPRQPAVAPASDPPQEHELSNGP